MAQSKQLTRFKPWHHDLMDLMITSPHLSGREGTAHFGVSAVWISIIRNSPIFRAKFECCREMVLQAVTVDIAESVTSLAEAK